MTICLKRFWSSCVHQVTSKVMGAIFKRSLQSLLGPMASFLHFPQRKCDPEGANPGCSKSCQMERIRSACWLEGQPRMEERKCIKNNLSNKGLTFRETKGIIAMRKNVFWPFCAILQTWSFGARVARNFPHYLALKNIPKLLKGHFCNSSLSAVKRARKTVMLQQL